MINNILLIVIGLLWFIDEILTIIDLKKFGINREVNPLAKYFAVHGKGAFTAFKILSLVVFFYIIKYLEMLDYAAATVVLFFVGIIYLIVDIRNFEIMKGKL
jgi:hypothetical protein